MSPPLRGDGVLGDGVGLVGAFASAVSSLIPTRRSRAGFFASSVGPTLAREAQPRKQGAERPFRRLSKQNTSVGKTLARDRSLAIIKKASRSAERGPFSFISREEIDI